MNWFILVIAVAVLCIQLSASANVVGRTRCEPGDHQPLSRKNSTEILESLRKRLSEMKFNASSLAGYIQYSTDFHMTEYHLLADNDRRVEFLSGFKGKGFAFVTKTKAAIFTARSFRQEADDTMDCNWSLLLWSEGDNGSSSIGQWFSSAVDSNDKYVGIDPAYITKAYFDWFTEILSALPHKLTLIVTTNVNQTRPNPVDSTWEILTKEQPLKYNKPKRPSRTINGLDIKFAGVSWLKKIVDLRATIRERGEYMFVATALDEIAWLFNLRGSVTKEAPYFFAFAIVDHFTDVKLDIDHSNLRKQDEPTDPETKKQLYDFLKVDERGSYIDRTIIPYIMLGEYGSPYGKSARHIADRLSKSYAEKKVWITPDTNYEIYLAVKDNVIIAPSPIAIAKSVKNPQELVGMRNSNIRDSVGLVKFLAFLEKEIKSGEVWTEFSAAVELKKQRSKLQYNRGLMFETIAGYGSNGAIPHYRPTNGSDEVISNDNLFVLDSGGSYLDGMTDVTRTMHYGQPTDFQMECYTRVLMAKINLALLKWPEGLTGSQINVMTLHQLWEVGLNYYHRKGDAIKTYMDVDEGPEIGITRTEDSLRANQFYTIEPGYYEEEQFGIRLESTFTIVPFTPKFKTSTKSFLQFDPVTFVPFEPNLIQYDLLNQRHVAWLNEYNSNITKYILPLLGNDSVAIDWLNARTKPYNTSSTANTGSKSNTGNTSNTGSKWNTGSKSKTGNTANTGSTSQTSRTANITISGKLDLNMKVDL